MGSAAMKMCRKCLERKPLDAFSKNARNKTDGRQSTCKQCVRKYYRANAERRAEYQREYRQVNAERIAEYHQEYRQVNAERRAEYNREHYRVNAERIRERKREYERANAGASCQRSAKRRAVKRNAVHEPYSRTEIFARWGNACCYCDSPAAHLDHVQPISRGGADAAWNLVPACAACNLSKGAKTLAEWA